MTLFFANDVTPP